MVEDTKDTQSEMLRREAVEMLTEALGSFLLSRWLKDKQKRMLRAVRDALQGADGTRIAELVAPHYNPYSAVEVSSRLRGSGPVSGEVILADFVPGLPDGFLALFVGDCDEAVRPEGAVAVGPDGAVTPLASGAEVAAWLASNPEPRMEGVRGADGFVTGLKLSLRA